MITACTLALTLFGNGWSYAQEAYLPSPAAKSSGRYGFSVALEGNTAAVGAFGEGVVHVLERQGASWVARDSFKGSSGSLGRSIRDPQSTSNRTTSLSDAIELAVCP